MKITDYIINIENTPLADRLILRQVLLDNNQTMFKDESGSALYKSKSNGNSYEFFMNKWCDSKCTPNISLQDFINKFKKHNILHNLAFYKRSEEPWTDEEFVVMQNYIGIKATNRATIYHKKVALRKYFYDDGENNSYHAWEVQNKPNFTNCLQVAYEDVFPKAELEKPAIKVGSHWERIDSCRDGRKGEIIQVNKYTNYSYVIFKNNTSYLKKEVFLQKFKPRFDLDKPQLLHQKWKDLYDQGVELEWKWDYEGTGYYKPIHNIADNFNRKGIQYRIKPSVQETVEQTKPQEKETKMNLQQLLETLFGAQRPTTDYDRRPAIIVVAYNRDGSEMGQAIANDINEVKAKIADTPELWGCKVLTYALDQEVSVKVPVKAYKAETAKSAKE